MNLISIIASISFSHLLFPPKALQFNTALQYELVRIYSWRFNGYTTFYVFIQAGITRSFGLKVLFSKGEG
jgi:hypothetical protein